ncbi:hypothetical protein EJ04DRAFT_567421 [Polyplosphaeria fusca]|uniref:Uncharacterized protein n=1 Tax=Polyplosphaeria fusca TaxID=682080 RepID=A0A9P4UW67_9PLEO|nr:hypothetical protein EJ04DRAFT_567421 [Polyplosphaeria fusca]
MVKVAGADKGISSILATLDNKDPVQQAIHSKAVTVFNPQGIQKDLLTWIVADKIPFYKLSSEYFRRLLNRMELTGQSLLPTDQTMRNWILQQFEAKKDVTDIDRLTIVGMT